MVALVFDELLEIADKDLFSEETYEDLEAGFHLVQSNRTLNIVEVREGDKSPIVTYIDIRVKLDTDYQRVQHSTIDDISQQLHHITGLLDVLSEAPPQEITVSNGAITADTLLQALALAKDPKVLKDLK